MCYMPMPHWPVNKCPYCGRRDEDYFPQIPQETPEQKKQREMEQVDRYKKLADFLQRPTGLSDEEIKKLRKLIE